MDFSLVTSEAYREIFQSMSEGIIMVNESGEIALANPVAEQLFGFGRGELTGVTLESLLPERYRKGHVKFRQAFNGDPHPRRMGFGRDLMALRRDGTEFPVEISLSYTQVQGDILVMAFISDISQRKLVEDALRKSEEQLIVYAAELEKKVELRTDALNQTIVKLEQEVSERKKAEEEVRRSFERERELNELKSKFVSIASHEFRTPLSTVMSSVSLIKQYKDRQEYDKQDKHINRVKSSVNQLTQILNDFLSLGKLEEGKVEIQSDPIILQSFLDEIKEEVQSFLKDGQTVTTACPPDLDEIWTDTRTLRNILYNLISNASKYSDAGKQVHVSAESKNSRVFFYVTDEGIGIPADDQKHLFDRFFRASNAGNIQGTGLGLHIVKRYVDLISGEVSFTSTYGKGSTFYFSIPQG
ncbi:PAS domain-containing sensor histidine kinase [Parachryseolinea silvisoli]|jgi:PAS domain S-box-containing protein|uniref:PAS domain-containing sensor histidine kinase n=1 Tax=Parachryseolinea silvisoli TaxID=2873601 RepID=UPI00226596CE|nr:PAS domain-containing sensor histidine kinase [Parachryseolinea silvisoli]MCD9015128.1 PAS domain-containing sensor histidine kinase [Parachryseolinea silvisoli]